MAIRMFHHLKQHLHAYLIALIGILGSLTLFYALQIQEKSHILSIAQLGVETIDNNIEAELAFDAHLLKHAAALAQKESTPKSSTEGPLADLLDSYPRLYALGEAKDAKELNWSIFAQNSALTAPALQTYLKDNAAGFHKNHSFWVSNPIILPGQKTAFMLIYPLKAKDGTKTYYLALIDARTLYSHSTHIPGMVFELYINHQPLNPNPAPLDQAWLFEMSQNEDGALWEFKAREESDQGIFHIISHEAPLSWITLVLGLLVSLTLGRSIALSDLLKREIDEHLQTEESKKTLEKALLQSQKLQAVGTLAGGIAHDFNNILYAIKGYVELAREDVAKDSVIYKNLGKVLEGTHRGQDMIARILSFSRRQHHELLPLTLNDEISGALSLLRPTIPQSVELEFKATTEGKILGNKTQIHQVIVNLINNAVDAMDGEGTIKLTLSPIGENETLPPQFSAFPGQKYCKIVIKDSGQGMDAVTQARIFEPFYTTKDVGKGTGLGLSTVHSIVKEHEGEIVVTSQLGKGSTFTLFFPEMNEAKKESNHG